MQTIHVALTTEEARAVTRACEFMLHCFEHDVRLALGVGRGETVIEIAALKIEGAIERQELGDRETLDNLARQVS